MLAPAPLAEALCLTSQRDGAQACHLLPEWCHGPGVYGGLQAALLLEAMALAVADPERTPRSLTAQFIAPATPGPALCAVQLIRSGRSTSHMAATLHRGELIFARASATLALPRDQQPFDRQPQAPDAPHWQQLADSQHGDQPPTFLAMLRFRDCLGSSPYSGAAVAHLGGWGRFVHPTALTPASVTAFADAWPPAVMACYAHMRRAVSTELSITFHTALLRQEAALGQPVLYEARSEAISEGFSEERATLWTPAGEALATATQRIVVFD